MNTLTKIEKRNTKQMIVPFGDWEKLLITVQYYKENKRYLSYEVRNLSNRKVIASKGMYNASEIPGIIREDYRKLGEDLESFLNFLEADILPEEEAIENTNE